MTTTTPQTMSALVAWIRSAPAGAMVPLAAVESWLQLPVVTPEARSAAHSPSWREKLWTVAPATRLSLQELCEATGRPKSWVYRKTGSANNSNRLPHRKLDGELVFVAGEIRAWIEANEIAVVRGGSALTLLRPKRSATA